MLLGLYHKFIQIIRLTCDIIPYVEITNKLKEAGRMNLITVFSQIVIINILILFGFHLRKRKVLSDTTTTELSKLLSTYIFPVFLFMGFDMKYDPHYNMVMLSICVLVCLYMVMSYFTGRLVSKKVTGNMTDRNTFVYNTMFGNVAFLGFPILAILFPKEGIFLGAFFTLIQNIFQWTIGIGLIRPKMEGEGFAKTLKRLIHPALIAVCLGILRYFLQVPLPPIVSDVFTYLKNTCIPLALIITGSSLYGYKIKEIFFNKTVQVASVFKTIILPGIFTVIMLLLPLHLLIGETYSLMIKAILTIQAAGPAQSSSTAVMRAYGGNANQTAMVTLLTSLYCAVTIPLFLALISLSY